MLARVLVLNLVVAAAKLVLGYSTGAVSIVSDGFHSLTDSASNIIGLVGLRAARKPPDADHPYGHRKFETAATVVIGLALLSLAWNLLAGALGRTRAPALPEISLVNWAVMAATIAVNLFVSAYEAREGRRLKSSFLVADAAHTRADLYVSLGVVGSFVAAIAGLRWADPLVAVLIAAIIAWQALRILLSAFDVLTDRAVLPAERLASLAAAVPGVREVHGVRTRGRGDAVYVDLTACLDGGMTLRAAHDVADRIEAALQQGHPEIADVVVHLEPDGPEGPSR